VRGYCLDVGCGKKNRFISEFLNGHGKGIDVFPYEELPRENLVEDITHFPFPSNHFESVTFIASINHIPRSMRDLELVEAYRCLKLGGNIIVTMGHPVAEILVHGVLHWYDHFLGTHYDKDSERGMHPEEAYFLTDSEIVERLIRSGFKNISKKHFWTQWGLNHMFIGWKR